MEQILTPKLNILAEYVKTHQIKACFHSTPPLSKDVAENSKL